MIPAPCDRCAFWQHVGGEKLEEHRVWHHEEARRGDVSHGMEVGKMKSRRGKATARAATPKTAEAAAPLEEGEVTSKVTLTFETKGEEMAGKYIVLPHTQFHYEDGALKIDKLPLLLVTIDGRMHTALADDPPAEFQSAGYAAMVAAGDNSRRSFNPDTMNLDPNTNLVTSKAGPDEAPSFQQVVFPVAPNHSDGRPGWTQNPQDPNAKWIEGFDSNGDPIFGAPPADQLPKPLPVLTEGYEQFRNALANPWMFAKHAAPDKTAAFIAAVLSAARDFTG